MAAALRAIRHRGPDDEGFDVYELGTGVLALGHTRLSILDLSSAGHQPMYSKDQRFSIAFNGEIYNYRELRNELRSIGRIFSSNSDTEVLLASWQEWGASCLPKLEGMFAFAIFDRLEGAITCVRDAFGIKPFFYCFDEGAFLFASEIPAVLALLGRRGELNWQRAYDYLVHGDYDSGPQTFLQGVFHLEPGHILQLKLEGPFCNEPQLWWSPTIKENPRIDFADAADRVRAQFLHNIRLHLRSDVPLGAALSGGVDSSAVACAMRHIEPDMPISTFSYIAGSSSLSEESWVDQVNASIGASPHKVIVSSEELLADLEDMIKLQGEPFGSTSIYAQYRVFKLAKDSGVTVVLDGQGADEMLAGYNGYPGQRIRSLLEQGRAAEAFSFLEEWARWPGRSRIEGVKRAVAEHVQGPIYHALRHLNGMRDIPAWINAGPLEEREVLGRYPRRRSLDEAAGRRVVAELAVSLTHRGLPALLRHEDRNSMRFSVESRVPFLTTRFVDLVLSLPESYLISPRGETKSVFRAAMRGIVPDAILNRRDKIGFATPERDWMLGMANTIRPWLLDELGLPFLRQTEIVKEFDSIVEGKRPFSWQVWRWVNFIHWCKLFL